MTKLKEAKLTMTAEAVTILRPPFVVFLGGADSPLHAKTGYGLAYWRGSDVLGQIRFPDCDVNIGVRDISLQDAVRLGARSLIIGVAPVGGEIPNNWMPVLQEAAACGLDVVSGLHSKLSNMPRLVEIAATTGASLIDVRIPGKQSVATGLRRSGRRLLTIGTDCAVGKKYSALAITNAMRSIGSQATFRASGQTGIMIAGEGIPIDAVPVDFVAGAAEALSPCADSNHWDIIEGQGSLHHPAYAAVSLGLLHGSQPDALVICHDPHRATVGEWPSFGVPSIEECIDLAVRHGQLTNPGVTCVGVCINSSSMSNQEKEQYQHNLENRVGVPCLDPLKDDLKSLTDRLVDF